MTAETATSPDAVQEAENRFTDAALARHKREGMELAVRARWIALAVIAVMLPFIMPDLSVLYYEALLAILAFNAWLQRRVAKVGRSRAEALVLVADLVVMTLAIVVPNPFDPENWPLTMQFRWGGFRYFYVLLAAAVLAYHWRTLMFMGWVTLFLWGGSVALVVFWAATDPALTAAAGTAFGAGSALAEIMDPNNPMINVRVQEIVVFLLVTATLAVSVRRFDRLLREHAGIERERANLARYFSPNVVDSLSQNDEPLKRIRTQDVAVLFVDIVGFTGYAAGRDPQAVIATLRAFHQRMEAAVFAHGGTLDKYLGDGLMATFGTPVAGPADARNALACGEAMLSAVEEWNAERAGSGEPEIRASVGVHYGPAVLGDIGANRLEFAVIGNTVNVASRVEALTRPLHARLAVTDDLLRRVREEGPDKGVAEPELDRLARHDDQEIRGLDDRITVWTLS